MIDLDRFGREAPTRSRNIGIIRGMPHTAMANGVPAYIGLCHCRADISCIITCIAIDRCILAERGLA